MSRTDARSTSLRRRPARTVPATITAVVLLALGVGLVWAAVQRLARGSWPGFADQTASWLAALTWGNVWVLILVDRGRPARPDPARRRDQARSADRHDPGQRLVRRRR